MIQTIQSGISDDYVKGGVKLIKLQSAKNQMYLYRISYRMKWKEGRGRVNEFNSN